MPSIVSTRIKRVVIIPSETISGKCWFYFLLELTLFCKCYLNRLLKRESWGTHWLLGREKRFLLIAIWFEWCGAGSLSGKSWCSCSLKLQQPCWTCDSLLFLLKIERMWCAYHLSSNVFGCAATLFWLSAEMLDLMPPESKSSGSCWFGAHAPSCRVSSNAYADRGTRWSRSFTSALTNATPKILRTVPKIPKTP